MEGDHVVAAHRLGHRQHGLSDGGHQVVVGQLDPVVVGVERAGHQVGVVELVAGLAVAAVEADAERAQVLLAGLGEQRHDEAGVQSAGEQHPDRHVGDQPSAYRRAQRVADRGPPVGGVHPRVGGLPHVVGSPVHLLAAAPVRLDHPQGGRRQLAHAAQHGARRGHDGVPGQVVVQRHRVDARVDVAGGQQRGQGGGEPEPPRRLGEVERFDAEPVAGQDQPPPGPVDQPDREHADQVVDETFTPVRVRHQDHLGVAGGCEGVPGAPQLLAQLRVVVDAAVEDQRQAQVVADHRLPARVGQVDDGQPAVPEGHPAVGEQALVVRAA